MIALLPAQRHALDHLQITDLNPMQQAALPAMASGRDMILLSPTGSGKTLAFLLPLLGRLTRDVQQVQAVVLVPSRELALQIESVFRLMQSGFKVTCCYGGHNLQTELNQLAEPPALLIGTPGRVIDLIDRRALDLSAAHTLILDEFDKSLELGFQPQMEYAIGQMRALSQRVLTSATDLAEIPAFVGLAQPQRLDYLLHRSTVEKLRIRRVFSPEADKLQTLLRLFTLLGPKPLLVFLNHRESVERVSQHLSQHQVPHEFFHGGLDQDLRERTLIKFRNGSSRILVCTDLAARGLDIPEIEAVIHYHLPLNEEAFTHRNGRTARMHAEGIAYLLLGPEENCPPYIDSLEVEKLPAEIRLPPPPDWVTLYLSKGKKAKINKVDIVGFLSKVGGLAADELGLVVVKDEWAFAAVKREKVGALLKAVRGMKLKGTSVKVEESK